MATADGTEAIAGSWCIKDFCEVWIAVWGGQVGEGAGEDQLTQEGDAVFVADAVPVLDADHGEDFGVAAKAIAQGTDAVGEGEDEGQGIDDVAGKLP